MDHETDPSSPQDIPTRIGPYVIRAVLGKGACGEVYRAIDPNEGRDVAIKVLKPGNANASKASALLRLFQNEAKLAARLRHPNIVSTYDAVASDEMAYIVMEQVSNGRTVQRHCHPDGELLSIYDAVTVVRKCAEGLHHAHERGVVHRDIKPRNILLDRANEPKIADFGLAVSLRQDATMTHMLGAGSPLYMAPEQILDEEPSPRTDIYSLALVLYELLAHRHPFVAATICKIQDNVLNKRPRRLSRYRPDVPCALERIVRRALSKAPRDRYASAQDFAADLDIVLHLLRDSDDASQLALNAEVIRSLPFFDALDDKEVRAVASHSRTERFRTGQALFVEGDPSTDIVFVVQGAVTLTKGQTTVAEMGRGACVDAVAAFTGHPRGTRATALTRTHVLIVSPDILEHTSPPCQSKLSTALLGVLAQRQEATLVLVP